MIDTREMRSDLLHMALAAKNQGAHLGGSLSSPKSTTRIFIRL